MNSITQDIVFKQSVVEYSFKHGVTEVVKRYKKHRKTIYRWTEYPFRIQVDIVSSIILQHLDKYPVKREHLNGSYSKGFLMKTIKESLDVEMDKIKAGKILVHM